MGDDRNKTSSSRSKSQNLKTIAPYTGAKWEAPSLLERGKEGIRDSKGRNGVEKSVTTSETPVDKVLTNSHEQQSWARNLEALKDK